jgi:hypothetical protein
MRGLLHIMLRGILGNRRVGRKWFVWLHSRKAGLISASQLQIRKTELCE